MDEHYEAVLSDLRRQKAEGETLIRTGQAMRDRAQSAIAALESIATKPAAGNLIAKSTARSHGGSEPSPEASASSPSEDNYQSLPVRTLALFRGNPQRVFTVQEVSQAVHPENLHLIHGLLSRLVKERRIVRAGRA